MKYFTVRGEDRRLDSTTRADLRGSFIELSDGHTHYELEGPGNGPVAVLVGGMTIPLFYWDAFAAHLHGRGFRTLAYSTYGRGYSDRPDTRYDEELFVRQLGELIDALGVGDGVHLVGTSMGALIAAGYMDRRASTVATLSLVGPAGLSNTAGRQQKLLRSDAFATFVAKRFGRRILLGHLGHNVADPALAVQLTEMIAHCYRFEGSMYAFFSTLRNVPLSGRDQVYRRAAGRGIPTLLVWGALDRVTPISGLARARELLRPERCHVIERCGHMAPYERPEQVADLLAAFAGGHMTSDRRQT